MDNTLSKKVANFSVRHFVTRGKIKQNPLAILFKPCLDDRQEFNLRIRNVAKGGKPLIACLNVQPLSSLSVGALGSLWLVAERLFPTDV